MQNRNVYWKTYLFVAKVKTCMLCSHCYLISIYSQSIFFTFFMPTINLYFNFKPF